MTPNLTAQPFLLLFYVSVLSTHLPPIFWTPSHSSAFIYLKPPVKCPSPRPPRPPPPPAIWPLIALLPVCYFWLPSGLIQHGAPGRRQPVLWQVTRGHTLSPVTCGGQPVIPVHSSSVHTHPAGRAHTNAVIHHVWIPARSTGCKRRFSWSQRRLRRRAPEIHPSLLFPLLLRNNIFFQVLHDVLLLQFCQSAECCRCWCFAQGWFDWMVRACQRLLDSPLSWHCQLTELMTTHSRCHEGATGQSANTGPHSTS